MHTHPSFGPQFLTEINQPGPGNDTVNAFDLSRADLNFLFTPTKEYYAPSHAQSVPR